MGYFVQLLIHIIVLIEYLEYLEQLDCLILQFVT